VTGKLTSVGRKRAGAAIAGLRAANELQRGVGGRDGTHLGIDESSGAQRLPDFGLSNGMAGTFRVDDPEGGATAAGYRSRAR